MTEVRLDGRTCDHELPGDCRIRESGRRKARDRTLGGGETRKAVLRPRAPAAAVACMRQCHAQVERSTVTPRCGERAGRIDRLPCGDGERRKSPDAERQASACGGAPEHRRTLKPPARVLARRDQLERVDRAGEPSSGQLKLHRVGREGPGADRIVFQQRAERASIAPEGSRPLIAETLGQLDERAGVGPNRRRVGCPERCEQQQLAAVHRKVRASPFPRYELLAAALRAAEITLGERKEAHCDDNVPGSDPVGAAACQLLGVTGALAGQLGVACVDCGDRLERSGAADRLWIALPAQQPRRSQLGAAAIKLAREQRLASCAPGHPSQRQLVPNTQLFSVLGSTYGGDGKTSFALPNLQLRAPMFWGQGEQQQHVLGEAGGQVEAPLSEQQVPPHIHALQASPDPALLSIPAVNTSLAHSQGVKVYTQPAGAAAPLPLDAAATTLTGADAPHNNMMPFLPLTFCIALEGVSPEQE